MSTTNIKGCCEKCELSPEDLKAGKMPKCLAWDCPCHQTTCGNLSCTYPDHKKAEVDMSICQDCERKYFVWFTDNVFWNEVMETEEGKSMLFCPDCFVLRAESKFTITGWRLLPEFPWVPKK